MSARAQIDWRVLHASVAPRLERVARSQLRSQHDVEDVVQDAFLAAWRSRDTLRDPGAIEGWLCRVVRNVSISRRRRKTPQTRDIEALELRDRAAASPEQRLIIAEALGTLHASQRAVLARMSSGASLREICAAEGISYAAAKTRCSRARRALAGALS